MCKEVWGWAKLTAIISPIVLNKQNNFLYFFFSHSKHLITESEIKLLSYKISKYILEMTFVQIRQRILWCSSLKKTPFNASDHFLNEKMVIVTILHDL